jgi:2-hydroxychromene-2-carboxylate isomerase
MLDEIGLDGARLVDEAAGDGAKARLRANTDAALASGVFGVPTMIVDDQLFWGYDDWPNLERYLRGEDPLTADDLEPWMQVRPGIQRKRR